MINHSAKATRQQYEQQQQCRGVKWNKFKKGGVGKIGGSS